MPGPGVQIIFPGIPDEDTADENDLKIFTGVIITSKDQPVTMVQIIQDNQTKMDISKLNSKSVQV